MVPVMSRIITLLLLAFLQFSVAANASDPTLVVENARVFVGDGTVLESGSIAVAGDHIVTVAEGTIDAPGARRIDAAGGTVMPGLIDTHVHLTMENLFEQPRSDAAMAEYVEERLPERLRGYIEAGITTVMSPGDYWPFVAGVRERVREGGLLGPRIYTAGPLFTAPDGHPVFTFCGFLDKGGPNPWCREHLTVEVATPQEASAAVARVDREGVDLIKFVYEAAEESEGGVLEPEVMRAIVNTAHGQELQAYAHIQQPAKAIDAIEAGLDGLVHIPAASSETGEVERLVELMQANGVPVATTLTIFDSFAEITAAQGDHETSQVMQGLLEGMHTTLARIAEADPRLIVLGTDSPHLSPGEAFHREVALLEESGLSAVEILRAATGQAAEYMGLGNMLGTLETGKLADFVIVDGDPTTDLTALKKVVVVAKSGEIVYERP